MNNTTEKNTVGMPQCKITQFITELERYPWATHSLPKIFKTQQASKKQAKLNIRYFTHLLHAALLEMGFRYKCIMNTQTSCGHTMQQSC
jgi:hypothetical protein